MKTEQRSGFGSRKRVGSRPRENRLESLKTLRNCNRSHGGGWGNGDRSPSASAQRRGFVSRERAGPFLCSKLLRRGGGLGGVATTAAQQPGTTDALDRHTQRQHSGFLSRERARAGPRPHENPRESLKTLRSCNRRHGRNGDWSPSHHIPRSSTKRHIYSTKTHKPLKFGRKTQNLRTSTCGKSRTSAWHLNHFHSRSFPLES